MNTDKNLKAIIYLLSITLLVLLFLNFKKIDKESTTAQISSKITEGGDILKLSTSSVENYFFNGLKSALFYQKLDSALYQVDLTNKKISVVAKIPDVEKIVFSPSQDKVFAFIKEGYKINPVYFNLKSNTKINLNKNINEAVFSPDGKKLVYHQYNPSSKQGAIFILNLDNPDNKPELILSTRIKKMNLYWPQKGLIAFHPLDQKGLFGIDLSQKNLKQINNQDLLDRVVWAKNGEAFIFSVKDEETNQPHLFIGNLSGKVVDTELKIKANQCTWSVDNLSIICGKNGQVIEFNKKTKEKKILILNPAINPFYPQISYLGNKLLFINKKDNNLYSVNF